MSHMSDTTCHKYPKIYLKLISSIEDIHRTVKFSLYLQIKIQIGNAKDIAFYTENNISIVIQNYNVLNTIETDVRQRWANTL